MLVKCDKCGQSYEVNDSRLSPQGARIKCPSCSNIFLVRLDGGAPVPAPAPKPEAVVPVEPAPAASVPDEGEESWKVRHMGLTYTFHDLTSLQDWLSGRPTLEDVKVAKNDDDWKELGDYSEVLTTEMITKFFPLGDVPKSGVKSPEIPMYMGTLNGVSSPVMSGSGFKPISASVSDLSVKDDAQAMKKRRIEAKKRAEAEEANKKKWQKYIILIVIVLLGIIGAICFMRFGGDGTETDIPVTTVAPEPKPPIEEEINQIQKSDPEVLAVKVEDPEADTKDLPNLLTPEEMEKLAQETKEKLFAEAEAMVKAKKWPEARATLESLHKQHPNDIPILQLLLKVYRGLNLNVQAADVEAKIKKIKSSPKNEIDFDE